jgi:hypothetical protein
MKKLYKTVIVIWSENDPGQATEATVDPRYDALPALALEAATGATAYCSKMDVALIEDPTKDPDWDGTEFFGSADEISGDGGPPYDAATATGMYDHDD